MLLVDDDLNIRYLYEQAFRLMGYNIETAVNGQDAINKLEKMDPLPALILLDMIMPTMTGFDVLNYMRHSPQLKNMVVVMLTSVSDEEAVEKAMKLGAVGYLIKTEHEPREIVAKVQEFIDKYCQK